MSTAAAGGTANGATGNTGGPDVAGKQAEALAADAERAVKTIEAKIKGMQASLTTAKADAKRLRTEGQ